MDKRKSMLERKSTSVILSVTSLVLIVCLLVVATYSWVDSSNVDTVQTNEMSLNLDTGLDAQWQGSDSNTIDIKGFDLREVSSANGRDFFVPDDSFNEKIAGDGVKTNELRFRRANASDIYDGKSDKGTNKRILQISFSLRTEVSDPTSVYLSGLSSISGTGSEYVRVSIDSHDGGTPTIFSNSVLKGYDDKSTSAVSSLDNSTGVASVSKQTVNALSNYTYSSGNAIFVINGGETKKVTISVWLEGASGNFDNDIVDKKDISISLTLTTKMDYTNNLTVVDRTVNNWIKNGDSSGNTANLFVFNADSYSPDKALKDLDDYYQLSLDSDGKTWKTTIPQSYTSVYIRRYSSTSSSTNWDYWGPLEIPGAAELNSTGTPEQRKKGISRKYNILGDFAEGTKTIGDKTYNFPTDLNYYSAGLWGDFRAEDFAEIKMFDQFSYDYSDQVGMYAFTRSSVANTAKYVPYLNMKLSYTQYGKPLSVNLRYRMYSDGSLERIYHTSVFKATKATTDITVTDAGIVPYQLGTNSQPGALVSFGSGWQDKVTASSNYFANTNKSGTSYWGTGIYYLGNGKIYESADQYRDVSYSAYLYKPDTDNKKWISLAKWNMNITKEGKTYYAFVLPSGYSNLAYCRMAGSRSSSTTWTNNWATRLNYTEGKTISEISKVSVVDSFAKRRVYFTYPSGWSQTMHAHCFTGKGNNGWRGPNVDGPDGQDNGKNIFHYDVPGQYENVIFSTDNGNESSSINLVDNDQFNHFYYDNGTIKGKIFGSENMVDNPDGTSSYKPHINIISSEDSVLP
ncbi:MAG: hypothetical protein PUE67_06815 [Oscillospiraceae bacterium]|nr:hypothetical protein [Oscillospiraceae bacterium]